MGSVKILVATLQNTAVQLVESFLEDFSIGLSFANIIPAVIISKLFLASSIRVSRGTRS